MGSSMANCSGCSACCENGPKYPIPYTFAFDVREPLAQNHLKFESNFIQTSHYNLLNFFPKALLLQFRRLANVYFLLISILLSIKEISAVSPLSAWAPLIIVIFISMVREGTPNTYEGYQDFQRYRSDKRLNYDSKASVWRGGKFEHIQWSQIVVGDVCHVESEDTFPADLLLVASSAEKCTAFIETASLDGEKNLKFKTGSEKTAAFAEEDTLHSLRGTFEAILPCSDMKQFSGRMKLQAGAAESTELEISIRDSNGLLYRGTRLKNTKWVVGLVIYTGRNTKIMMNSESSVEKMSELEKKVNHVLMFVLVFQLVISLGCASGYMAFRHLNQPSHQYIDWPAYGIATDGFLTFLTYFSLLNTMIPISLVVSIEMAKLAQKYFIDHDRLMYSTARSEYSQVHTSALNEELGQVDYIFTDKTGTLTQNLMEFKIAIIGTQSYGETALFSRDADVNSASHSGFHDARLKGLLSKGIDDQLLPNEVRITNREGQLRLKLSRRRELAEEYFLALSLAHEVVRDLDKSGKMIYQGPSPDEIALVEAAEAIGYEFVRSSQTERVVRINGSERYFEVLQLFPFTPERKKMSIVIRDGRSNLIKIYTKGVRHMSMQADSFLKERLAKAAQIDIDEEVAACSLIGLRTLIVAMRIVSEQEYSSFLKQLETANSDVPALQTQLESHLFVIGATAVLDRLQKDVPETLRDFIRANIKVWMLTGDKLDIAENIAKSCKLIQNHFAILRYDFPAYLASQPVQPTVLAYLKSLAQTVQKLSASSASKAFLIDGNDLKVVLSSHENKQQLAQMAACCETVICCRLVPLQKAEVISMVREYLGKITLAIGDGANDVPMIKTAHIGVGLIGEEGASAVQASDYALPQFRMLWRLLFVHGRWNYIRISEMILYFFYKNMLFTFPQFVASFYNGFSGSTVFDGLYISLYNLVFTGLPLLIKASLEQDVYYVYRKPDEDERDDQPTCRTLKSQQNYLPSKYGLNKNFFKLLPKAYFIGQDECIFNNWNYLSWMGEGVIQSILISVLCFYMVGSTSLDASGVSSDYNIVGLTMQHFPARRYSSVILIVTFKLATHTRFWSWCFLLSIVITSLGFYVAFMWISNFYFTFNLEGTVSQAYTTGNTYLLVLFCVVFVLFVDGAVVFADFQRGGYSSKMRRLMHEQQADNLNYFGEVNLTLTGSQVEPRQ